MPQIFGDRLAKRREAVVAQRHPQLHGAESSRQLQRFFEKRIPLHRVCARGTSIVATMGERLSRPFGRPIEQTAAVERLIQPFVRVERNRVRKFQTIEFDPIGHCRQSAIGAVNVKPCIVALGDLRNLSKWINRTGVHRTRGSDDRQRSSARGFILENARFEFRRNHAECRVRANQL